MARLGEIARSQSLQSLPGIPGVDSAIERRTRVLLPELGSRLIKDATQEELEGGRPVVPVVVKRLMPCGLEAAEMPLPASFLRLAAIRLTGWRRSCVNAIGFDSDCRMRQWSGEPGIAGSPECPRAYLDEGAGGLVLRAVGCATEADTLDFLRIWEIPEPDAEGCFLFPTPLYPRLVSEIASNI